MSVFSGLKSMQAVLQEISGDETTLSVGETNIPDIADTDVLIQVCCTALNQMDLLQCKGFIPVAEGVSKILGVEASGIIAKVGSKCSKFKVGDRVLALLSGGGYAEYAVADERTVMLAPTGLSMTDLAALPEEWVSAYSLLFSVAGMKAGESVLVHFGASGIGQAAIQLASRNGIKCYATAFSDDKVAYCKSMGATDAFNIVDSTERFASVVLAANGGKGVDVVLDPIGAGYVGQNLDVLARDGRWVLHGLIGGEAVDDASFLGKLLAKRICILPSTLRGRDVDYKHQMVRAVESEVLPRVATGEYKVNIDSVHDMTTEGTRAAHRRLGSYMSVGKVVLKVASDCFDNSADANKRVRL